MRKSLLKGFVRRKAPATLLPTGAIAFYHLKFQPTCACSPKASAAAANLSVTA